MTGTISQPIDATLVKELRDTLGGTVIMPDDLAYESARRVWNGMIDRRPAMIVRCAGVDDVLRALEFAHANRLLVAPRGGGHNIAGLGVCDGGMVVDLSAMNSISVDPKARVARVQGGALWGAVDRATAPFDLATPGGQVSTTGVAGLTLGGGMSWLHGKHGLTCDNLLGVEIITADGRVLEASADDNADLFWAVRGGGGNFGVVTRFDFRLHPLTGEFGGMMLYPMTRARELMRMYREFNAGAPDEMMACAAFATPPGASLSFSIVADWCGQLAAGERLLGEFKGANAPAVDLTRAMTHVEVQTMLDAAAPAGMMNYWKACYLGELSDEAIDVMVDHAARVTSPMTIVLLVPLRGMMSRVADDATAFANRSSAFTLNIMSMWSGGPADPHVAWTRAFFTAMRPFSSGGVYVNDLAEDEGEERVRAAYGANYARLAALKAKYDPSNFFQRNQNITPAAPRA